MPATWCYAVDWNIATYGAIAGDGIDDLAAFNLAIANASAGDRVIVPAGTFNTSGAIVPKSGISLVGAGRDASSIVYSGASSQSIIDLNARSNVELSGVTLNGNNNALATQGISGGGGQGHFIHDLRVQNLVQGAAFGPHGIYFEGMSDNRIVGNEFVNIGTNSEWGAGIRLGHGSSRTQVIGNTITNTGRGGILANDGSTDLVIRGNTITGSGLGPNGPGLGIELFNGVDRSLVEYNQIDHWLSLDRSSFVAVRHNTIASTSDVKYAGLEMAGGASNNIFSDNTVTGGAHVGVSVSNNGVKELMLWSHNTITGAETWGAQIQGDAGGASRLYFYGNTFEDTVRGQNNLFGLQGHGFRFNGNVSLVELESNQILNNGGAGLQGDGFDFLTVVGNTISGNQLGALDVSYGPNLYWSGNTVTGNNGNDAQPSNLGTFNGNARPVVTILPFASVQVGQPVQFNFDFTDDGEIGAVLWDFGEGLPIIDQLPTHTFNLPGLYRVGLVVWDDGGRAAYDEILFSVSGVSTPEPGNILVWTLLALVLTFSWWRPFSFVAGGSQVAGGCR